MTIDAQLAELADLQTRLAALQAALPGLMRRRLQALDAQYAPALEQLAQQIAACTTQVKAAVLARGHSVQGHGLHAVYVKGRVAWDDRALLGYATTHPEIVPFRTEGAPSVSLRKAPDERG